MSIKFYNLPDQYNELRWKLLNAIDEIGANGQYFEHQTVCNLENKISSFYNNANVVAVNSGTSALIIALRLCNLPKNSLVAIPAMTYVATANAVVAAGYKPVCVDIDDQWLMDYNCLQQKLAQNKKIKAVITVDLYGQGVDIVKFKNLCNEYKVKLIVDAAQSFGLQYHNCKQIDCCDVLTLSFNPLKNLGAIGNAGAVVSKAYDREQIYRLCTQGKSNGDVLEYGYNVRMDAVQAAVLLVKIESLTSILDLKARISNYYKLQLEDLVEMPVWNQWCSHTHYVFPIASNRADDIKLKLNFMDIEYSCHYEKPVNMYSAYLDTTCIKAANLAGKIISLPNHWHLTFKEFDKVVDVVKSCF